jgi:hypothetical protein
VNAEDVDRESQTPKEKAGNFMVQYLRFQISEDADADEFIFMK